MTFGKPARIELARTVSTAALVIAAATAPAAAWAQTAPVPSANGGSDASTTPSAASTTGQDVTQNASSATSQEIVVRGLRNSISASINDKRNSNVQIDEINAQDIADFPDSNLAESLQRLPGVSIDRDNGEGRGITVRGLNGDFNRTRLNGMEALSTAGSNDSGTSPNRSRSFDYNTFASELFSSLRVQKTPSAETDEGSLGATIDLVTGKPFDYKGTKFALSSQASYNVNSKRANPRLAGLASFRFGKDKSMGLLLSGAYNREYNIIDSYQRSPGQSDYLYRSSQFLGEGVPQRAGFAAPAGTSLGYANPDATALQTGSDPAAYAALYPGSPYNTPGRYDDSQVRIPALPTINHQIVQNQRLGFTGSYQAQIFTHTRLTIDGLYSRFHNVSENDQLSPVGLNRNNTNATYNNAAGRISPSTARGTYPGLCTPNAGSDIVPAQDCGSAMYGSTPAFSTALDQSGKLVSSVLGAAATQPGGVSPTNANIFSVNPYNLDPYDYYNNPNSVGYIAGSNNLAYRGQLIGRPAVDVLSAHVTNGLADYLVLKNVDMRSAVDYSAYTTTFWQGTARIDQDFTEKLHMTAMYGQSKSVNYNTGLLVEFNRMDSPGNFVYDERGGGPMPVINFGFNTADPANWQVVKGFSAMRHYERYVSNTYKSGRADFVWEMHPDFTIKFGGNIRQFGFATAQGERNTDTLNPTLLEAGSTTAANSKLVSFGQGLSLPTGTVTSFIVPDLDKFNNLLGFECNCINKYGDWRLTYARNGGQNSYSVTEKDKGFYLQFDFDTELFGARFRGNAGTRVSITDLSSFGTSQAGRPIVGKNHYTDYLPSINLVYEPIRNVLARFSASKVIARPLLGNLSPTITAITVPSDGSNTGGSFTIGNPKLSPFRSSNLDLSIEWYPARGSLISVAFFDKEIQSFPQTILYSAPLSQFVDADTLTAIKAQYTNVNQLAYLTADYPFTARQYRDAPGGYLRGIEANVQQNFTFLPGMLKNFGALVNYTYIKSQLTYILDPGVQNADGSVKVAQTLGTGPFIGVSPRALNATLFYEDSHIRGRVSLAHRAGFVSTYPLAAGSCSPGLTAVGTGTAVTPTESTGCDSPLINDFGYTGSTNYVDASFSFNVFKIFAITLEALNITNQTTNRSAYQAQSAVTYYGAAGRVFRAGARVSF